ncbi:MULTISPECIES: hypothetical protein [unclassified Bradyrhizobium]|uniref:hypothetical protein n=1 Tax=unclassified Bradyrhizobium TaxID=2631580 RepID=UPI00247AEE52|nr:MULTISPECIES: hypothetical protein [unclassified Bradyrhizobium]WGR75373.1 hypothetical protein MTX24_13015 [Bradyrhizobium sp. ISRA426]WGR83000.1 hypothetical protein MTX21_37985 [Bradyrhizobium sp. ISRA430]WGR90577.1 hypothetical protein MTX25_13030 [Bradyrhizobium sp. ISRA432]
MAVAQEIVRAVAALRASSVPFMSQWSALTLTLAGALTLSSALRLCLERGKAGCP